MQFSRHTWCTVGHETISQFKWYGLDYDCFPSFSLTLSHQTGWTAVVAACLEKVKKEFWSMNYSPKSRCHLTFGLNIQCKDSFFVHLHISEWNPRFEGFHLKWVLFSVIIIILACRYSKPCLSRILWDLRNSFSLDKFRPMWVKNNRKQRKWTLYLTLDLIKP